VGYNAALIWTKIYDFPPSINELGLYITPTIKVNQSVNNSVVILLSNEICISFLHYPLIIVLFVKESFVSIN
jgi:hypothetical protein